MAVCRDSVTANDQESQSRLLLPDTDEIGQFHVAESNRSQSSIKAVKDSIRGQVLDTTADALLDPCRASSMRPI
jgi:hypothetical protein